MATTSGGGLSPKAFPPLDAKTQPQTLITPNKPSYTETLQPKPVEIEYKSVQLKSLSYVHREPCLVWDEEEVNNMIIEEKLQYVVVAKFSYSWPEMD